ncbi:MAG: transposase family protein [Clostridia bacterium]|nr:transposase family protein [Clostridia bacterium]
MLTKTTMQEIQNLKLQGLTQAQIIAHYKNLGLKPPSRPTIAKYYAMDVIPENPGEKLAKDKAFDVEPFRSAILRILELNEGKDYCMSSVYDVLAEQFIENGNYDKLPGNEQTLRNYIHHLEETGQITRDPNRKRVYNHVFDTPPGDQMLIDFGVYTLSKNQAIHFICLLLRYSRFLLVYAQDHKYSAEDACAAIYMAFCRLGGRVRQLVIDQDAVFISSETYGEVIKTRVFEDFCTEQNLRLFVCRKADPESKGPIENSVGFVKKNFFSARKITCIDDV